MQYALKNMATTAGYADDLRLTLAMETELVTSNQQYFDGTEIGDYVVKITVDPDGKAELVLAKKGKTVKSVPAALKKDETFNEVKEFAAKLKNQYSRCVAMFERAMEEEDPYSYGELRDLCVNPVTAGILNRLVFIGKGAAEQYDTAAEQEKAADGQILLGTLEELRSGGAEPAADAQLLVAHPITLYRAGRLPDYQRMFFEKQKESGTRQPFKQVFREFYVKLEEEKDAKDSRMFAGYQIQPKKTVAALRGRRWVADYDEGLQKVFFKQNISATIYALADWFSPADTECPTLEYVSFYDRKTYRQKNLSEIPDILYSEVMRDVDLAVSVAHVGGVDPSNSTWSSSDSPTSPSRELTPISRERWAITMCSSEAALSTRRAAGWSISCRSTRSSAARSSFLSSMKIPRRQRSLPKSCCSRRTTRSKIPISCSSCGNAESRK